MKCFTELSHIMYFAFSILCECGEELNSFIVALCVYAMFCKWLPLLELEHGMRDSLRLFEVWRAFAGCLRAFFKLG
jgi:hypothetical protein